MKTISLREIAARYNPSSIADAKRALKECGLKQTLAPEVIAETASIEKARNAKRAAKHALREEWRKGARQTPMRRPEIVTIPSGTPSQRLSSARKTAVENAFIRAFRQPAHGSIDVILTDDPAQVGVVQRVTEDWDLYAKSYGHGPARVQDTTITAPEKWIARVQKRGIAMLDGMMTLDAAILEGAPDGVTLYAARWASQGRGTSVNVSNGIIAISGNLSYHADSAPRALAGIKRKIAGAKWQAELRTADLSAVVARIPHVLVKLSDARAIGACEYGIRSWCARTGIDYESGQASVAEVYAAYQNSPAPEARGAILHAARRARQHLAVAA